MLKEELPPASTSVLVRQGLGRHARRGAPNPLLFRARCARNSKGLSLSGMHLTSNISRLALLTIALAATTLGCVAPSAPRDPASPSPRPAVSAEVSVPPSPDIVSESPLGAAIAQAAVNVRQVTLVEGLEHPWGMAWLPDGSILVTERPGRLRVIRNGRLEPQAIAGVPPVLTGGQAGLLDITLHPNFAANQWVYLSFAAGTPEANRTRVVRARLVGNALQTPQVILEVNQAKSGTQHFGSRFLWLPDGTLLVSIGDGGNPPVSLEGDLIRRQAQNLNSYLGKILRINEDGSIPPDNPFANAGNAQPAIWSYGHRNIQGMAFDPVTNRVWATEHGSRGGDELNLIEPGQNYGWPIVTHSREYFGGEISQERSRPGMVDPRQVWTPAIAPAGLAVYRGDRVPQWQGDLFAGGLVDRGIRQLKLDAAGNVVSQQQISIGQRVRDVRQGPDGLLYVLTDDRNGRLVRLEPAS